jgi:Mrp family chromosome partitioning ATPase
MLAWARTNFDRVIIDCTPMFPINDTLLWGRHVPSAVIVVSYGKTRTPLIRNATQKMQSGGGNILGMVVNRATPGGLAYASYGYYYHQYYHAYHREPAAAKHS